MTRPTDWDFSKIGGKSYMPPRPAPEQGPMPAFAIHIEKRVRADEALPWADTEFERISKSPRRPVAPEQPMVRKRRFPKLSLRRAKRKSARPVLARARVAFRIPRVRLPRIKAPRLSLPRIELPAMPRVSLPRVAMPRFKMPAISAPHISMPRMPKPRLPDLSRPRAASGRGLRAAASGLWVSWVALSWVGAELLYFARLNFVYARIHAANFSKEARAMVADFLPHFDRKALAKQAAILVLFATAGYGAAVIVGPALKDSGVRLAALPEPSSDARDGADAQRASDLQVVIAAIDNGGVPVPMPRIAHVPVSIAKKAVLLRRLRDTESRDMRFAGR